MGGGENTAPILNPYTTRIVICKNPGTFIVDGGMESIYDTAPILNQTQSKIQAFHSNPSKLALDESTSEAGVPNAHLMSPSKK